MIPRIKSVKPLKGYRLYVIFDDGRNCIYDVNDDISTIKEYGDLKTVSGLFEQVQLDESRTCIYWNDFIDLPSDTVYEYSVDDEPMEDELEAIREAKADTSPTIPHNAIDWD